MTAHETAQSHALRRLASEFRTNAAKSGLPWFTAKMNDAANELEVQAFRIDDAETAHQAALAWH